MPLLRFGGVGISGLSAAVPTTCYDNLSPGNGFTDTEAAAVVELTGIRRQRVASPKICASDLCYAAADSLLDEMTIDRATIDVLIFVSQTPDHRMPATAILLQDRLGFSRGTAAYDVNLALLGFRLWALDGVCVLSAALRRPRVIAQRGDAHQGIFLPR